MAIFFKTHKTGHRTHRRMRMQAMVGGRGLQNLHARNWRLLQRGFHLSLTTVLFLVSIFGFKNSNQFRFNDFYDLFKFTFLFQGDWMSHRANHCGSFWSEEECLAQTADGPKIYYTYMCEKQLLYGGPHRPASSCRIPEDQLEKDYCQMLTDMGFKLPITIIRTKGRAYLDEKLR